MGMFDKETTWIQDGVTYEMLVREPLFAPGAVVRRFTYGQEPRIIALVPLAGGGTVAVHGLASHWSRTEVAVDWTDDRGRQFSCVVPAADVRRPNEGEWHGRYVPR